MKGQSLLRSIWESWRAWFSVGIGVKRWLILLAVGAIIAGTGISALLIAFRRWGTVQGDIYRVATLQFLPISLRILIPLVVGFIIIALSIVRLSANLIAPFRRPDESIATSLYRHSRRGRGPHIVAIGGGTGLPNLLRSLTDFTSNITAVVTVADDGGSSGRLRRELGLPPPGDFRNNIAALARDEALMTQLLQYRFAGREPEDKAGESRELRGHAFGNLLLAALAGVTGSFDQALAAAGRVLAIEGRVLPSTLTNVMLEAEVRVEGQSHTQSVIGESLIPKSGGRIERVRLEPATPAAYPPAVQAILQADLVIIGPGSLYTSILPNLLIPGIASALYRTEATRLYICNLATQPGETDNYDVSDHLSAIDHHLVRERSADRYWVDMVLVNNNLSIPSDTGGGNTQFVEPVSLENITVLLADLVDEQRPWRHDSKKLSSVIANIAVQKSK